MAIQRRMLYATIWDCSQFSKLSERAQLLYIGTITIADDDGRFKASTAVLRAKIFPTKDYTLFEVEELIEEILKQKLVVFYEDDDDRYGYHPNWLKYQELRKDRKKESLIPLPPNVDNQMSTKRQPSVRQPSAEVSKLSKESKEYNAQDRFEEFWKIYPRKVAKSSALKAFKKLKLTDDLFVKIIASVEAQKKTEQWKKDKQKFVPHPSTFLNGERWNDELNVDFETGGSANKFKNIGKKI